MSLKYLGLMALQFGQGLLPFFIIHSLQNNLPQSSHCLGWEARLRQIAQKKLASGLEIKLQSPNLEVIILQCRRGSLLCGPLSCRLVS